MKTATMKSIRRAWDKAAGKFGKTSSINGTSVSAGFVLTQEKKPRKGFQVFVRMVRYDEALLQRNPDSGGLFAPP